MTEEPSLGENVRFYRLQKTRGDGGKWRQEDLAEAAGVSTRAINMLEGGSEGTKLETILAVAAALQKHPSELFRRQSTEAVSGGEEAPNIQRVEVSTEALRAALIGAIRELAAAPEARPRVSAQERLRRARRKQKKEPAG